MHEFEEVNCAFCDAPSLAVNLDGCLICETFNGACAACISRHQDAHKKMDRFKREIADEPEMTIRERINKDLKAQLRKHTETICGLLDERERLIKSYEKQCNALANEVDRLRSIQ